MFEAFDLNERIIGTKFSEKDRCKVCKGEKTVDEKKMLEVMVQRGMHEGERICFRGEADQEVPVFDVFFFS